MKPRGPLASTTKPASISWRSSAAAADERLRRSPRVHALHDEVVQVGDAGGFCLSHERQIEIRTVPVRVRDRVMRARGDEQLPRMRIVVSEALAGTWKQNVKPRLRPAATSGPGLLPRAPLREDAHARQVVLVCNLLEQQVRQRRGRFADGEARVTSALEERDALAAPRERQREERPGEARADDRDVGGDRCGR